TRKQEMQLPAAQHTPTNIILLYRGHIFSISTIHAPSDDGEEEEEIYSLSQLAEQLAAVLENNQAAANYGQGVAALTHLARDDWAKYRAQLIAVDVQNQQHLQTIERALFCITIDENKPE